MGEAGLQQAPPDSGPAMAGEEAHAEHAAMHALGHRHGRDVGPAHEVIAVHRRIHRPVILDQAERKRVLRIERRQCHEAKIDPLSGDRFDGRAVRRNLVFPQIDDVDHASPL